VLAIWTDFSDHVDVVAVLVLIKLTVVSNFGDSALALRVGLFEAGYMQIHIQTL
jgi:hypothetical protein